MTTYKLKYLRYNYLDYCFRKKSYSFKDLKNAVNDYLAQFNESVSTRTLKDDLKVFRSKEQGFDAPLPSARIYQYSDSNFSIANRPLLSQENDTLEAAIQLLERFENNPQYDRLNEALISFQDNELQNGIDYKKVLYFDHNEEYKGIKYLKPLVLAIQKKRALKVHFQGFKDKKLSTFEFHPQILKQYNRRWFIFGFNKTMNIEKWSIPLDERLKDFEILDDITYKNTKVNWSNFFRQMVGVVKPKDAQVEQIVLQFYNGREKYFNSKPFILDSDESLNENEQGLIWFDAIINKEIVQQILAYGKDVEVKKPESLRKKIQEHLKVLSTNYQ